MDNWLREDPVGKTLLVIAESLVSTVAVKWLELSSLLRFAIGPAIALLAVATLKIRSRMLIVVLMLAGALVPAAYGALAGGTPVAGNGSDPTKPPKATDSDIVDLLGVQSAKSPGVEKLKAFTMGGTSFGSGLGVKNEGFIGQGILKDGSIDYQLDGKYSCLMGSFGVHDAAKNSSLEVMLLVRGDGRELYRSPFLIGGDFPKSLNVDLHGVQQVSLEIYHNKDRAGGIASSSYSSLGNPRLSKDAAKCQDTTPPPTTPAPPVKLTDLPVLRNTGDQIYQLGKFSIGGSSYPFGFSVKTQWLVVDGGKQAATVDYNLEGKYKTLTGAFGVHDSAKNVTLEVFLIIKGDGKELYRTKGLIGGDFAEKLNVDVSGVNRLSLEFWHTRDRVRKDVSDVSHPALAEPWLMP